MTLPADPTRAEPWMRGTHGELGVLQRAAVHALEQAVEDAERWAVPLDARTMELRPGDLPSVGFHLRHMARSLDRLLTYAEGRLLDAHQLALLDTEAQAGTREATLEEFRLAVASAITRASGFAVQQLETPRGIGRMQLPTTVGGLLVHCAEHTQRHSGQMVTTAKLVSTSMFADRRLNALD